MNWRKTVPACSLKDNCWDCQSVILPKLLIEEAAHLLQ
jgi:hypothetical protein